MDPDPSTALRARYLPEQTRTPSASMAARGAARAELQSERRPGSGALVRLDSGALFREYFEKADASGGGLHSQPRRLHFLNEMCKEWARIRGISWYRCRLLG